MSLAIDDDIRPALNRGDNGRGALAERGQRAAGILPNRALDDLCAPLFELGHLLTTAGADEQPELHVGLVEHRVADKRA